jgi:hypothetical protein
VIPRVSRTAEDFVERSCHRPRTPAVGLAENHGAGLTSLRTTSASSVAT